MDVSNLSVNAKVKVFQKLRLGSLVKVRKTSKELDHFVEEYRHEIAKCPATEVDLIIDLNMCVEPTQKFSLEFSAEIVGTTLSILLADPYKQLSAVAFGHLVVENKPTRESLFGYKLEEFLENSLFSLLTKMKPTSRRLICIELTTPIVLKLAEITSNYELEVDSKVESRPDLDISQIIGNDVVLRRDTLLLRKCLPEQETCEGLVQNFPFFSTIGFIDVRTSFIISIIDNLCITPDVGSLSFLLMKTKNSIFHPPQAEIMNSDVLCSSINGINYVYAIVRLFEGVQKWIVCYECQLLQLDRHVLRIALIEKDLSILLKKMAELLLSPDDQDTSSIHARFINARDMKERHLIFQEFATRPRDREVYTLPERP